MKTDLLQIVFRAEKSGEFKGHVTAVFPTIPEDAQGHLMRSYAHVGQHGACCMEWYARTRAAKPEEYADLERELRQRYDDAENGFALVVVKRITPRMNAVRRTLARSCTA